MAQSDNSNPEWESGLKVEIRDMHAKMIKGLDEKDNAMSLIYFWSSLLEKRIDSLIIAMSELDTAIQQIDRPVPPVPPDTSAIARAYFLLDSARREEIKQMPAPSN